MIALTDKDGRLTVAGTAREWSLFLDRLERPTLVRMNDTKKAREMAETDAVDYFRGVWIMRETAPGLDQTLAAS